MKLFILILFVSFLNQINCWKFFHKGRSVGGNVGEPAGYTLRVNKNNVKEEWFTQKLDHFDPSDNTTWKQKYQINTEFFNNNNAPVFLMIGGEGPASVKWMTAGAWYDSAKQFGALMFQVEHRYYGESHPTEDVSVKNLQYLSSEQALADLANFISDMNQNYNLSSDVKWIAFGGSYSGSLAAWLRFKYPHLVHGAMSSSGPLLAEVDFPDYFKVVVASLSTHSDECVDAVKNANEEVHILLKDQLGQKKLDKSFELCEPIEELGNDKRHLSTFVESLAGNFAGVVQYNKDNRLQSSAMGNITIDDLCDIMVDQSIGTPLDRLAAVNSLILNATNQTCLDYNYDKMIKSLSDTSWSSNTGAGRQWTYQTCTEFGFFQTSSNPPQIFGSEFPVDYFIQMCVDIFGPKYNAAFLDQAIQWSNTFYGALDIQVSNVVFVHGSIDPWHALGVIKTREQGAPAIYIEGTAHCANLYPPADYDPPQLKAARVQVDSLIDTWLRL